MKKTLMVFACTALLAASLSACGSKPAENKDTGTASSAAASSSSSEQQKENTLTGSLDEKKNGMFVVTDAGGLPPIEFTSRSLRVRRRVWTMSQRAIRSL